MFFKQIVCEFEYQDMPFLHKLSNNKNKTHYINIIHIFIIKQRCIIKQGYRIDY